MKKIISIILILTVVLGVCFAVVACEKKEKIADNTKYYDSITKTLHLNKDFENKSFMIDGIGRATVDALTDGDTTRFVTSDNDVVIIRYYCIDTPESTGGVEKWGKAASLFVKDKLTNATEIVLESSTGGKPEPDSYGSRMLGYVWYKTGNSNFKLLNLELVENGFSENKAINTSEYIYYDYFKQANDFAKSIKLRKYSELDDPLYSTEPVEMTIKEFWNNTDKFYTPDTDSGAKVIFVGYLESLTVSPSGTYTFVASEIDEKTGEKYSINVYCAYASNPASKMKLGHKYKFIGSIQNYNKTFQVSGINYNSILQEEMADGSYIIQKNYFMTFDSSAQYYDQCSATLFEDVTVVSSKVENGVLTIEGKARQRRAEGFATDLVSGEEIVSTFKFIVKVGENYVNTYTEGSKFSVQGYQLVSNSGEIMVLNLSDIKTK